MNRKLKFVLLIPIINSLADILVNYFKFFINLGDIRAIVILTLIIHFLFTAKPGVPLNFALKIFILYLFFLVLLSSDIILSLELYFKFFISLMMFPIGYVYIKDVEILKKLNLSYLGALVILLLSIGIANIFNLGTSDYVEGSLYFGSARVNITKSIAVITLIIPFLLTFVTKLRDKLKIFIIFFASMAVIILGLKRSALLSLGLGLLFYFIFAPGKTRFIKNGVFIIIVGILTFSSISNIWTTRYQAREGQITGIEENYEKEARYREIITVLDAFERGDLKHKVFGSEMFNDRYFFNSDRMLHIDYSILLNGGGVFGLICFLYIHVKMIINIFKTRITNQKLLYVRALVFALVVFSLFVSVGGSIYAIGLRSLIYLYLGALFGIADNPVIKGMTHNNPLYFTPAQAKYH